MKVPNLPHPIEKLIQADGSMHPVWYMFFNQLTKEMQTNLSEEGLGIPQQSSSNISILENKNHLPSFVIDKDAKTLKVSIDGIYKTVQTI